MRQDSGGDADAKIYERRGAKQKKRHRKREQRENEEGGREEGGIMGHPSSPRECHKEEKKPLL